MRAIPVLVLFLMSLSAHAEYLPRHHKVQCGTDFLCPPGLERRVDFWADVFSLHNTDTAVFHDRKVPERVYSVLHRKGACGGRNTPPDIRRERKRLAALLESVAGKKAAGSAMQGEEKHIADLFAGERVPEIRKAADRIRCQTGNANRFREGVRRFGEHKSRVAQALKEFGLPDGVQYLPFVESSYNPEAYSRVGAAGLWQLMPATARHLGLEVNPVLDERMDPELATLAAIRYLQHSFEVLAPAAREIRPDVSKAEIFPFVITSYNYGVNGMLRAMRAVGVDFVKVLENYKSESFQVAVKNFYASFLAARHVATHADQYFSGVAQKRPRETVRFALKQPLRVSTVISHFGVSREKLKKLNPALTSGVWKGQHLIPRGYVLRLPKKRLGSWDSKIAALQKRPADQPPRQLQHYRVRKGDSACGIAHRYKVSCRQLIKENRLGRRGFIRIGQILTIPGGSIVLKKTIADARQRIFGGKAFSTDAIMDLPVAVVRTPDRTYRVAKGDTACAVAKKFSMACADLARLNHLGKDKKLVAGQLLTIPGEEKRVVRSSAAEEHGATPAVAAAGSAAKQRKRAVPSPRHPPTPPHQQARKDRKSGGSRAIVLAELLAKKARPEPEKKAEPGGSDMFDSMTAESPNDQQSDSTAQEVAQSFGSTDQYYVTRKGKGKKARWQLRVQPDETLGHYADWLGGGVSSSIRRLNGIKKGRFVQLGQKLNLPIRNEAQKHQFEEKRIAYHRALQSQFFEHFRVTGSKIYAFQPGDSGVNIADRFKVPLWLLRRFNPDILRPRHKVGEKVVLPLIEAR